jgi:hypothetical protein
MVDNLAKIRKGHPLHTSQKRYCRSQLFSVTNVSDVTVLISVGKKRNYWYGKGLTVFPSLYISSILRLNNCAAVAYTWTSPHSYNGVQTSLSTDIPCSSQFSYVFLPNVSSSYATLRDIPEENRLLLQKENWRTR